MKQVEAPIAANIMGDEFDIELPEGVEQEFGIIWINDTLFHDAVLIPFIRRFFNPAFLFRIDDDIAVHFVYAGISNLYFARGDRSNTPTMTVIKIGLYDTNFRNMVNDDLFGIDELIELRNYFLEEWVPTNIFN